MMVHEIGLRVAPVIGVEARDLFLLGVVEDGVGAGPSRSVMKDVRQQGLVELKQIEINFLSNNVFACKPPEPHQSHTK